MHTLVNFQMEALLEYLKLNQKSVEFINGNGVVIFFRVYLNIRNICIFHKSKRIPLNYL